MHVAFVWATISGYLDSTTAKNIIIIPALTELSFIFISKEDFLYKCNVFTVKNLKPPNESAAAHFTNFSNVV